MPTPEEYEDYKALLRKDVCLYWRAGKTCLLNHEIPEGYDPDKYHCKTCKDYIPLG
mgnify:CR=1